MPVPCLRCPAAMARRSARGQLPAPVQPVRAAGHPQCARGWSGRQAQADGNAEHHVSPRGQIRVRFPWQRGERADDRSSRWVRVAQRQAGAGMGWQWLPRIGHEVLVKFADDDIDQPFVIGAVYNGQGEAGIAPTPGGKSMSGTTFAQPYDASGIYAMGCDNQPSAQGNLAGGNSPAWHGMGAAPDGHRNAAALTGFKSQEHGGRDTTSWCWTTATGSCARSWPPRNRPRSSISVM
ncbi:protein of unknown function [Cupriavidus taiwanensis]|nr:protein of unknown function [Cupriavidus taiwanensis]